MRDNDMAGHDLLLHAPHRADGKNPLNPQFFHRKDVRAVVDGGGRNAVSLTMAGQEGDPDSIEGSDHQRIGGLPEWGRGRDLPQNLQVLHLIETASADDTDPSRLAACRLLQAPPPLPAPPRSRSEDRADAIPSGYRAGL